MILKSVDGWITGRNPFGMSNEESAHTRLTLNAGVKNINAFFGVVSWGLCHRRGEGGRLARGQARRRSIVC